jgi:hypothetical protein
MSKANRPAATVAPPPTTTQVCAVRHEMAVGWSTVRDRESFCPIAKPTGFGVGAQATVSSGAPESEGGSMDQDDPSK